MCMMHRQSCVALLIIWIVSIATAQVNPVYQAMQRNKSTGSEGRLIKDGLDKLTAEGFAQMGYSDTTIANLRNAGVDLSKLRIKAGRWDEKDRAALSDCIVLGTVKRIEHPKGNPWFQTVAYVDAEEFLRNDYNISRNGIPVMIVSGPTTELVGEDTVEVGEHVLLFLGAAALIRFAQYNLKGYFTELINDSTIRFKVIGKYRVESGRVLGERMNKSLDEVKGEIRAVMQAVHGSVSTKK